MLQPALARPGAPHETVSNPTYGEFFRAATNASEEAFLVATSRGLGAERVRAELYGYERFLVTAAKHIRTLMTLAEAPVDAHWRLDARLERRDRRDSPECAWTRAADYLGTAHDVLMTHFTGVLVPRTSEAQEFALGPAAAAACVSTTQLLLDSIEFSRQMMRKGMLAQKHRSDHPIPTALFRRIRDANQAAGLYSRSTLWELRDVASGRGPRLDDLLPAVSTSDLAGQGFESSLMAFRVMRQIAHIQARTGAPASAASIRDLALLGSRLSDPERFPLDPSSGPGIGRLLHAHAQDRMEEAHTAWIEASTELTETVRGVTRAPAAYGLAARSLLSGRIREEERLKVLQALPVLASDAGRTVLRMTEHGCLVSRQRDPGQVAAHWRPIDDEHGRLIAGRFTEAALLTRRAVNAVRDLQAPNEHRHYFQQSLEPARYVSRYAERRGPHV